MHNPFETEERQAFRDTVRDFVAREIRPHADAWDEAGEVPWELHRKAGALGLFGFGIDERYGGLGFDDAFMRAIYAEEISQCGATGVPADLGARSISVGPHSRAGQRGNQAAGIAGRPERRTRLEPGHHRAFRRLGCRQPPDQSGTRGWRLCAER